MSEVSVLQVVFSLALVVGMIGLTALIARRFSTGRGLTRPGQPHRLNVLESRMLDARRRLLLVRCDRTEHLLLLGATHDVVLASFPASESPQDAPHDKAP